MIPANIVEYDPIKSYDQGDSNHCSAYAVLVCVIEMVEQKYGIHIEFDIPSFFYKMMKVIKPTERRVYRLLKMGMEEGFTTKDGEYTVFVKGQKTIPTKHKNICLAVQNAPVVIGVRRFKEHDLSPKGYMVAPLPEKLTEKKSGHVMILIGFNKTKQEYVFQNSHKIKDNVKGISFKILESILKYVYSIMDVELKFNHQNAK